MNGSPREELLAAFTPHRLGGAEILELLVVRDASNGDVLNVYLDHERELDECCVDACRSTYREGPFGERIPTEPILERRRAVLLR